MSEPCTISTCEEPSFGVCNCCQRSVCKQHMSEHYNTLDGRLNPLVDEINGLDESLKIFDKNQGTSEARETLEQWRVESHDKIERLYEKTCQELNQYMADHIDQQTQGLQQLRSRLVAVVCEQATSSGSEIDSIALTLDQLKKDMIRIEQTHVQIRARPLILADDIVQVTETIRPVIDLSKLSSPSKSFEHSSKSCVILASNDKCLLMHQAPNLCLMNEDMNIVQQVIWPFERILDAHWSSTLGRFILINDRELYLVHENIRRVQKALSQQNPPWSSMTCSDTSLFLSTNDRTSSIYVFTLLPTIQLANQWQYPTTPVPTQQEKIDNIVYSNGTLALLLRNPADKSVRLELRFSSTFDHLWSLALDITSNKNIPFHLCSLSFDEWLVADYQNNALLHITKSGQIKSTTKYPVAPFHVHLFKQRLLVVLTRSGKFVHCFAWISMIE